MACPQFDKETDMFSESHGLIFRSFVYLFKTLQEREDQEFTLTASYLEIYNEKVSDGSFVYENSLVIERSYFAFGAQHN